MRTSVTLNVDQVKQAVKVTGYAIDSRSTMPVLAGLRFQGGHIAATNMETTITANSFTDLPASVIPAKILKDIIAQLEPGEFQLTVDQENQKACIAQDTFQVEVNTFTPEDFPSGAVEISPSETMQVEATFHAETFITEAKRAGTAASRGETRPVLCGVLFEPQGKTSIRMVATDNYRLYHNDVPALVDGDIGKSAIIPNAALAIAGKVYAAIPKKERPEGITLRQYEGRAELEIGKFRVITRLIEGNFPEYERLIPDEVPGFCTVDKAELAKKLKRVAACTVKPGTMRLRTEAGQLIVSGETAGKGSASESVKVIAGEIMKYYFPDEPKREPEQTEIGFNAEFMADALKILTGDSVTIFHISPLRPGYIAGSDSARYLIMPVRLTD